MMPEQLPLWAEQTNCAITICDCDGIIIYMNERARETFASHGPLIGKNLFDCHKPESARMIRHMLATGQSNAYTITKNGQHKVIYQTPWRQNGQISGMVEISMVVDAQMPHYNRDAQKN